MNPIVRRYALLGFAGVFLIVALVLHQLALNRATGGSEAALTAARELGTSLAEISALAGNSEAPGFAALATALRNAETAQNKLKANGASDRSLAEAVAGLKTQAEPVLAAQQIHPRVADNAAKIGTITTALFPVYEQIAEKLAQKNAPSNQIYTAAGQLIRIERLGGSAGKLASAEAVSAAEQLERESKAFVRANQALAAPASELGFVRDPAIEALAKKAGDDFAPLIEASAALSQDAPAIAALQLGLDRLKSQSASALDTARARERSLGGGGRAAGPLPFAALVAGVLALILLVLHGYLAYRNSRQAEQRSRFQDSERQGAILKLLDEITNLANGDLTGTLTVTEDFTGNIADSLNYTVDTLRSLVGTINVTSVEIAAAAANTTRSAQQMNEASEGQAREIVLATQSINASSRSLEEVASRAERIAEQAKSSVEVAHNGAATVGRTIQGMSTLREQIQDTAKRIKRLGESSQEIGNIIEFINDIAEQTNTLALNASIQAAMAGESGRGFAVVADEVQRLAERAGSATRQIESLVKTIQADTQEAVTSMERSTANVVGGAKSAEEAGLALTRIESSSQELSRLIQEISGSARKQSADTTRLADAMQGIRGIAVQTSATAQQTAQAVGELNLLSAKLRDSVSGFKLPTDVTTI